MFDLRKHIPGDLITAKLPLTKPCFQSCLPQFFAQSHGIPSRVKFIYPIIAQILPDFYCYKKFICYFSRFGL